MPVPIESRGAVSLAGRQLRILIAEAEGELREFFAAQLSATNQLEFVEGEAAILEAVTTHAPDLIILCARSSAAEVSCRWKRIFSIPAAQWMPRIFVLPPHTSKEDVDSLDFGADAFLFEPLRGIELTLAIRAAMSHATARREGERRFQELAEYVPLMIWVGDVSGYASFLNKQWCSYTGTTREEGLGWGWLQSLHPEDRPSIRQAIRNASERHEAMKLQYRLRRHDGQYRWVVDAANPRFAEDGSFVGFIGAVFDTHARHESDAEIGRLNRDLELKVAELETLLRVMPIGVGIALDSECRDIRVNPSFAALLGLSEKENASLSAPEDSRPTNFKVFDIDGTELSPAQLPLQVAAREGRTIEKQELDVVRSDGMRLRLLEYAAPLFDSEGLPRGSVGAFIDISERTAAEARQNFIMRLNDALQPLIDPEEIVAMSARLLGEYLDVDRCAYAQVESDEDTMLLTGNYLRGTKSIVGVLRFSDFGSEVLRLMRANEPYVIEDAESEVPKSHRAAFEATQIRAVICVPLHKAGKFVAAMAVHQTHVRVWSADQVGLVQMVANRCWEALERARVTRELRQSEERLRSVLETTPECVTIILADGMLEYVNSAGVSTLGFRDEGAAIGYHFADLVVPESREEWLRRHHCVIQGERLTWEFEILSVRGERRWLEAHAVPFIEADGTIKHLAVSREVSGRKRLERQREELLEQERAARSEAERVNRMKDEFLATLSHELRTPLNAILGWAQLLLRQKRSEEESRQGLDAIERNAQAQRQIIEDLLDMNRIVSGKIRLDVRTVAIDEVLLAAIDAVRPILHAKRLELTHHIDPHRALVSGDASRLQQVFWNLLTNATKFTPPGGRIRVEVERMDAKVEIRVSDTGQGIKGDFLPYVFERFQQEDSSLTRNQGGLGLGLSIVRSLVEIHAGAVHAQSAGEGKGATFVVTLPIAQRETGHRPPEVASSPLHEAPSVDLGHFDLSGIQALVVDDDRDARGIVERLLQDCGATVSLVASGEEALRSFDSVRPNLLISDIGMPRMDGYELLSRVRKLPDEALRDVPAIALTAFARAEDRERALTSGFQAYVSKPLDPGELLRACSQLKEQCCRGKDPAADRAVNV